MNYERFISNLLFLHAKEIFYKNERIKELENTLIEIANGEKKVWNGMENQILIEPMDREEMMLIAKLTLKI